MKYLGIDFGLRKIGLAVSEGELASPWQILEVKGIPDAAGKVAKLIKENNFQKIIVGLPEGKMKKNVIGFINVLQKSGITAETAPETLSSKKALEQMIEYGLGRKKRGAEDAYSAAEILQNYMDNL